MFRFHPHRRYFAHEMAYYPPLTREQAMELVERGDRKSINRLIEGHSWLARDIAGRALDKLGLPSHLGEELAAQGLLALGEAVPRLTERVRNIPAYLSKAIEEQIQEFLETDAPCWVPTRTNRDRKAQGKPRAKAPTVKLAIDLCDDEEQWAQEFDTIISSDAGRAPQTLPGEEPSVEDLYVFCADQFDMDIIELRYDDGAGPRCLDEVAQLIGLKDSEVDKRLDAIEDRYYAANGRRKPTRRRSPGKRYFPHHESIFAVRD